MKQIIAMHGWSGDSNNWQMWHKYFQSKGWTWGSAERGYGQLKPYIPQWKQTAKTQRNQRRVVIAHSLGFHLIEQSILAQSTDLVLLGSFSRFRPNCSAQSSVLKTLKSMQEDLGTPNENIMLTSFLEKACFPSQVSAIPAGLTQQGLSINGRRKLEEDLKLLIETNGLPLKVPKDANVLVVEGEKDIIIHPKTKKSLLNDLNNHLTKRPIHWILKGMGHALLDPSLINKVYDWLESNP